MNLLSDTVSDNFIYTLVKGIDSIELNWIGDIVKAIIECVSITAIGIILFTLILKTIVLPLDIYSKYKTKKQSLIMEQMRPQMEKLQKQYANDKNMYNQKVSELYKKNGYSMMGACLPVIVSLVIFMVVFSQFSTYSQYANLEVYNDMVNAYNGVVSTYVYDEDWTYDENWLENGGTPYYGFLVEDKDPLLDDESEEKVYYVNYINFIEYYNRDMEAHDKDDEVITASYFNSLTDNTKLNIVKDYIREEARKAAAEEYRANKDGFLWIGNIWYPDSMLNKEVPTFSKFQSTLSRANISDNYEESYNEVTANLTEEKDTYNGYFVLIVLAIGMMLLSQFISMRTQKSMNELSTVDGSGAKTNKWMMILMPVMYGIFSFFYSAGFSIYMITNTTYSLVTTLIVNKVINERFKKLEERNELDKYLHKSAEKKEKKKLKRK